MRCPECGTNLTEWQDKEACIRTDCIRCLYEEVERLKTKLETKKRRRGWPADLELTPDRAKVAERYGRDPVEHWGCFKDWALSKGSTYLNWDRAWSTFCRPKAWEPVLIQRVMPPEPVTFDTKYVTDALVARWGMDRVVTLYNMWKNWPWDGEQPDTREAFEAYVEEWTARWGWKTEQELQEA